MPTGNKMTSWLLQIYSMCRWEMCAAVDADVLILLTIQCMQFRRTLTTVLYLTRSSVQT